MKEISSQHTGGGSVIQHFNTRKPGLSPKLAAKICRHISLHDTAVSPILQVSCTVTLTHIVNSEQYFDLGFYLAALLHF